MRLIRNTIFFFLILTGFTGPDPIDNIRNVFKRYQEELPQEKVYLHLDRSYYSSGDKIWLKAYLVAGTEHLPSTLSRTLYIELFNGDKKLIRQLKLYVNNGSAAGNIQIPDSLATGNYLVRAYTQWMRNSGEDYFFQRTLKIYNLQTEPPQPLTKGKIDLQFFPEGGDWVNGLKSKLALKAVGQDGLGKQVRGKIVDETGQVITLFQSNFLGMGYCEMIPDKSHTYSAELENTSGSFKLPAILDKGVTLSITQKPELNTIVARIQNNTNKNDFYLIGQTRGFVAYSSRVTLPNTISFVKITMDNFPTGVAQFTLVDSNGLPNAERLAFIDQHESLTIKIKPDKEVYAPREKISIEIEVHDQDNKPSSAQLSLAFTDDQQAYPGVNQESIYSYLYLSSELKGPIESPGYYFNSENEFGKEDLDVLLLTQGWRRFNFERAMNGFWPDPTYQVEQGLVIRGKMTFDTGKKPVVGGKVKYLSTYPYPEVKVATTDEHGEFEIPKVIFFDSAKAMLQGETKYGHRSIKLVIDSVVHIPALTASFSQGLELPEDAEINFIKGSEDRKKINDAYNFNQKSILLETVTISAKKESHSSNNMYRVYGAPAASIQVAGNMALENQQHPLQILQGRIAGVQVTGQPPNMSVTIRGTNSILSGTQPMFLLNNISVDIGLLNAINVMDIESILVYKGADAAMFGARGAGGVIAIVLKSDITPRGNTTDAAIQFNPGYQTYRQFYSPHYDVRKSEDVKPDRRATLHWAPFIKTDSAGKATITFYNHDLETSVTGIAEGLNSGGIPGSATISYTIKK